MNNLPGKATVGGYIYVIEYSTGVVKVGRTVDPATRFKHHRQFAEVFDAVFTRTWLSPLHGNYKANEVLLLGHAKQLSTRMVVKEYFHGVDFDQLVALADSFAIDVVTPRSVRPLAFSLREVADTHQLSLPALTRAARAGHIEHVHVGRQRFMTEAQVSKLLARLPAA